MASAWNEFQKANAGSGMSQRALADKYLAGQGGSAGTGATGAGVKVVDHSKKAFAVINTGLQRRLKLAALMYADKVKKSINVSTRRAGPSKPGDYPHKDTGKLQQSIQVGAVVQNTVRIGAHVNYARALELGTNKMAPRPFLRPILNEMYPTIVRVVTGK